MEMRSLLFVPADSARKMEKARGLGPDGLLLDLEDAVSPENKLQARTLLAGWLAAFAGAGKQIFVRVNGVHTLFFAGDLEAAVHPALDGLALPKVEDAAEVAAVDAQITRLEEARGIASGETRLLLFIESPAAVLGARDLARSSPRVVALMFGAEDYCAGMGITRTRSGEELSWARSAIAHAARACSLQALDTVFTALEDDAGFLQETRRIRQMGFTGKLLIHPRQIDPAHRAFAPDEKEIAWAERVLQAFEGAGRAGLAVTGGQMIDQPIVLQAKRILSRRDAASGARRGAE